MFRVLLVGYVAAVVAAVSSPRITGSLSIANLDASAVPTDCATAEARNRSSSCKTLRDGLTTGICKAINAVSGAEKTAFACATDFTMYFVQPETVEYSIAFASASSRRSYSIYTVLTQAFDSGKTKTATDMATEIRKAFTDHQNMTVAAASLKTNLNYTTITVAGSFNVDLAVGSGCITDPTMKTADCSVLLRNLSKSTCEKVSAQAGTEKDEIVCPALDAAKKVNFSMSASGVTATKLTLNYVLAFDTSKASEADKIQKALVKNKDDLVKGLQTGLKALMNSLKAVYDFWLPQAGAWTGSSPISTTSGVVTVAAAVFAEPTYSSLLDDAIFAMQRERPARLTAQFKLAVELVGDGVDTSGDTFKGCSSGQDKLGIADALDKPCTAGSGDTCEAGATGQYGVQQFAFERMEAKHSTECRAHLAKVHKAFCALIKAEVAKLKGLTAATQDQVSTLIDGCAALDFDISRGVRNYSKNTSNYVGYLTSLYSVGGAGKGITTMNTTGCKQTNKKADGSSNALKVCQQGATAANDKPKTYWATIGLRFDIALPQSVTPSDLGAIKTAVDTFMADATASGAAQKLHGQDGSISATLHASVKVSSYTSKTYYGSIMGALHLNAASGLFAGVAPGTNAAGNGMNLTTGATQDLMLTPAAVTTSSDVLLTRVAARICKGLKDSLTTAQGSGAITCPSETQVWTAATGTIGPAAATINKSKPYETLGVGNDATAKVSGGFPFDTQGPFKTGVNFLMYVEDGNGSDFKALKVAFEILIDADSYTTDFPRLMNGMSTMKANTTKAEILTQLKTANSVVIATSNTDTTQTMHAGTTATWDATGGEPMLAGTKFVTWKSSAKINLSNDCKSVGTVADDCSSFFTPVGQAVCKAFETTGVQDKSLPCVLTAKAKVTVAADACTGTPTPSKCDGAAVTELQFRMAMWPPSSNTAKSKLNGWTETQKAWTTQAKTLSDGDTSIPTPIDAAILKLFPKDIKGGANITDRKVTGAVTPAPPSAVLDSLSPGIESGQPIRISTVMTATISVATACQSQAEIVTACDAFFHALEAGVCTAVKAPVSKDEQDLIIPPGSKTKTPNCSIGLVIPSSAQNNILTMQVSIYLPASSKKKAELIKTALTAVNLTSKKTVMETAITTEINSTPVTTPVQKPTTPSVSIDVTKLTDSTMTEWKVQGTTKLTMVVAAACTKEDAFNLAKCSPFRSAITYGMCGAVKNVSAKAALIACPQDGTGAKFGTFYPKTGFLTKKKVRALSEFDWAPRRQMTATSTAAPTEATMHISSGWISRLGKESDAKDVATALKGQETALATAMMAGVLTQVNAMMVGASKPTVVGTPEVNSKDLSGATATQSGAPPVPPSSGSVASFGIACVSMPLIIAAMMT